MKKIALFICGLIFAFLSVSSVHAKLIQLKESHTICCNDLQGRCIWFVDEEAEILEVDFMIPGNWAD
jgi:hypothetical protein